MPTKQVKEEAESLDIKERTLARAKKALKVEAYRKGIEGKQGGGEWFWRIAGVKVASTDGWQPKSSASPESTENSLFPSQKANDGLRLPSGSANKAASDIGNLNQPEVERPRPLTEEQVRQVQKLISQGMEPSLARDEVLKIDRI